VVRGVLAIVAGYLVMAAIVALATMAAFVVIGADRVFHAGTFHPSALWLVTCFSFSFIAAILGGIVCARIGGRDTGTLLGVLVFVLGIAMLAPTVRHPDAGPVLRPANVSARDAMIRARQPLWATLAFPIIGAVGTLIGARGK